MLLAAALRSQGELSCAEAEYRGVLTERPAYADGHYQLGLVLQLRERPLEAIACFQETLKLKPDHARAANDLGCSLSTLNRPNHELFACFRRAVEIDPNFADAHNNLGCVLRSLGRLGEAEAVFRRAIELKPNYAGAYNNLGNVLADADRLDEAGSGTSGP